MGVGCAHCACSVALFAGGLYCRGADFFVLSSAKRSRGHKISPSFQTGGIFFLPRKNLPAFYIDATAARVDDVICQKMSSLESRGGRPLSSAGEPTLFSTTKVFRSDDGFPHFRLMKSLRRLGMTRQKNPKIAPLAPSDVLPVPPGFVHALTSPSNDTEINNRNL